MPQVFKIGSYWVYFWANENDPLEPIHVHVSQGAQAAMPRRSGSHGPENVIYATTIQAFRRVCCGTSWRSLKPEAKKSLPNGRTSSVRCGISADLANFPARPQKCPAAALQYMQTARETEQRQKIPAGKRGFFHAQSSENGCFSPLCSGADAAGRRPPGAAAGVGISGRVPRRVGRAVRRADALQLGADAGVRGGLLRRRGGRGPAGPPAPRVRGAVAGQSLSALCGGGRRGCAVALAGPVPPCRAGGLRGAGAGSRLLCLRPHGRRGRSPADLRSGALLAAALGFALRRFPPETPGAGMLLVAAGAAAALGSVSLGAALPRRGGLCRRRACPLLPGPAHRRPSRTVL